MVTTTDDTNVNPRLAVLVKLDDPEVAEPEDVAVALSERDSIELEFNEENDDFEAHSRTDVITDPTTQDPKISLEKARAVSGDALEEFGVVDSEGNYSRGAGRSWEFGAEVWYFTTDADIETDAPDMIDELGEVRWDIGSISPDGNTVMYDLEGHIEDSSDVNLGGS